MIEMFDIKIEEFLVQIEIAITLKDHIYSQATLAKIFKTFPSSIDSEEGKKEVKLVAKSLLCLQSMTSYGKIDLPQIALSSMPNSNCKDKLNILQMTSDGDSNSLRSILKNLSLFKQSRLIVDFSKILFEKKSKITTL